MPDTSSVTRSVLLTQRQAQVLQATVRHYITTAEPVGSKALAKEYDFSVSSATIRNTMGSLEKAGFLYQPHTSAGRIPSDSGYRIYVDQLLVPSLAPTLVRSPQLVQQLSGQLDWDSWSLEAVLRRAAQILSNLSGYITLITLPHTATARLRHLQLVPVEGDQVMLIVVTTGYETRSTCFVLPQPPEGQSTAEVWEERDRDLQILSNFLNSRLRGQLLQDITHLDWQDLEQELRGYADVVQQRLSSVTQQFLRGAGTTQMVISGIAELLHQPEFTELQQVQALFQLLEEGQEQLWPILVEPVLGGGIASELLLVEEGPSGVFPAAGGNGEAQPDRVTVAPSLRVYIGAENPLEPMRVCSLVSALYYRDKQVAGSVGVLGPTRMAYEQTIAAVKATASYLSEALSSEASSAG